MKGASGGTETVAFESCDSFNDEKLHATFRRCTSDHESCATIGYHVECSEIASSFGLDKRAFVPVARYSYEPSVQEDERRREWILNHLHQIMSEKFTSLPPEILLMICKHLVLHYAIASLSHVSRSIQCTIEPLKDVWATHFDLDGIEYIASLSNMPKPGSSQLWREVEGQQENYIFISEDHLGIRQIVNDPGAVASVQGSSGWWRTLPITSKVLSFSDDVSFMPLILNYSSNVKAGPQIAQFRSCSVESHHLLAISHDPKCNEEHGLSRHKRLIFKSRYDYRSSNGGFGVQRA